MIARDYMNSICKVDISTIDEVQPDLLMIITGGPIAYARPDGVKVLPLACLRD